MINKNPDRFVIFPYLCALAVILVGAFILDVKFLPILDFGSDGFQSELMHSVAFIDSGFSFDPDADSPLILVHVIRLLAVSPFLAAEGIFGSAGQIALLMLALSPLVFRPYRTYSSILYVLPFFLPLAISGRAVLVIIGVGYIVMYVRSSSARPWFLWLGLLWVILSSASVFMSLLLLLFAAVPSLKHRYGKQRWVAIGMLIMLFTISALDKIVGFQSGDVGYASQSVDSDNIFLIILSRSTLFVSLMEGQYLRAVAYLTMTMYFLFKASNLLFFSDKNGMRRVLLCCLPGLFIEGLGMLALCLPLLWVFLNFDPRKA